MKQKNVRFKVKAVEVELRCAGSECNTLLRVDPASSTWNQDQIKSQGKRGIKCPGCGLRNVMPITLASAMAH